MADGRGATSGHALRSTATLDITAQSDAHPPVCRLLCCKCLAGASRSRGNHRIARIRARFSRVGGSWRYASSALTSLGRDRCRYSSPLTARSSSLTLSAAPPCRHAESATVLLALLRTRSLTDGRGVGLTGMACSGPTMADGPGGQSALRAG